MNVIPVADEPFRPDSLRWSPDGRTLGVVGFTTTRLYLLDPAGGPPRTLIDPARMYQANYGFTADGEVVLRGPDGGLHLFAAAAGSLARRLPLDPAVYTSYAAWFAVTPDGTRAVVIGTPPGGSPRYELVHLGTGAAVGTVAGEAGLYGGRLAFSPCGKWLATGEEKHLRVWPVGPVPPKRATAAVKVTEGGYLRSIALSAGGRWIAATARVAGYLWDTQVKGREAVLFRGRGRAATAVAFHPARPLFATAGTDQSVCFWDPATGEQLRKFAWKVGPLSALAFSLDGYQAAAAGDGRVVVWDVD